ncbi:iron complex transport system ATP-binding protein [Methylopila capsulata]|uniref:ABC transporter ATP-binding protein n=1 Tax=Methylopila capsulata TaxID=61654 RepID=A0A9W6IRJ0_9HYPH|nr:ATP-binding cassette domain-containing protein [Methylopila capsulata]MBM7850996.1 iron complex transport system ATP-binding protein [Methylopila capsulata]GLK54054.1 ABC transporter ATP-binding protein [Methylopila capsulata]
MIRIENVSLTRGGARILHDVSLTLPKGGLTALIGPNGAGKSSLLSLIARLQPLQTGRISVEGLPVDATPGRVLARTLAVLRQDPGVASRLRVRELVGFGRFPHSRGRLTPEDDAVVAATLDQFDLTPLKERFVETLSGGQRQRALIAMTVAQATDYLLLDEPLNNLDMRYARDLMRRLRARADAGRTIVAVLHDVNQAAAYADRIVALRDGRLVAMGAPAEIMTPETLDAVFGYRMRVVEVDGRPMALHHL